jgi:hypothetical protein
MVTSLKTRDRIVERKLTTKCQKSYIPHYRANHALDFLIEPTHVLFPYCRI